MFIQNIKHGYNMISIFYLLKNCLISIGFLVMFSSLVVVLYLEKLWCFANRSKISITDLKTSGSQISSNVATISMENQNFSTSIQGVTDKFENTKRKSAVSSWHFQN